MDGNRETFRARHIGGGTFRSVLLCGAPDEFSVYELNGIIG